MVHPARNRQFRDHRFTGSQCPEGANRVWNGCQGGGDGDGNLVGLADAEAARHAAPVRQPAFVEAAQQGWILAVAGIGDHDPEGHVPGAGAIDAGQGDLRLRLEGDVVGRVHPGAAGRVAGPRLVQVELRTDRQ